MFHVKHSLFIELISNVSRETLVHAVFDIKLIYNKINFTEVFFLLLNDV
jgi:hypothetical protein